MIKIPKIIHQIWSGIDEPLPELAKTLAETWKRDYPNWEYRFWDNKRINSFILQNYPQYWGIYSNFPYDIQRWDVIRYLILYKIGGMYVDFDYESIKPLDKIINNKSCCFALEPKSHCAMELKYIFNNALMFSVPCHPFMGKIIETVLSRDQIEPQADDKNRYVLSTTGPWALVRLYKTLSKFEKKDIYLIPAKYVTPFDLYQAKFVRLGFEDEELINSFNKAYAVHYFLGSWLKEKV